MFTDVPWRDEVIDHSIDIHQGKIILSDRPGWGVDLVEAAMDQHPGIREARPGFYI